MKKIKSFVASLTTAVLLTGLAINFNACTEQSPLQPANNLAENEAMSSLAKRGSNYPQSAERTLFYIHANKSGFQGGNMQVPNGSTLKIKQGALTPPPGWPLTRITLTMVVEKDDAKNELIFTFGPAGCQFNPPAEVWFDWSDLGSSNATL